MRKLSLLVGLVTLASISSAQASSYLDIYGAVHDPILTTGGAVHPYSGTNLQPGAYLAGASLNYANLSLADLAGANLAGASLNANLSFADLTSAYMTSANLNEADLTFANLAGAELNGVNLNTANLAGANLSGANLNGATLLQNVIGIPDYDALTNFAGAWADYNSIPFDPVAAGWNLIPEPNTALLLGIGMMGLGMKRRRTRRPDARQSPR